MKKLIVLALVILAVCLTFAACSCEHQYEEKITTEASCSAVGIKTFTCTKCNGSYTEEIPMIEHSFGTATVTKEPTCTEEGEKSVTCKACGTSKVTDTVSKKSHAYVSEITTESTCSVAGVKTYTCSACNDSYTTPLPMLAHIWTSKVTTEPTCTAEGVKTYTCTKCASTQTEAVAKISHTYTSKVTTEATCTTSGVKTFTCKGCGNTYTEKVAAKGHSYSTKTNSSATCTSSGSVTHTCKACGDSYTETIAAKGHKWINATCTETKYCSRCGITSGSALGHTTDDGTCTRCGQTVSVADKCSLAIKSKLPYYVNDYLYDYSGAPYNYFKITSINYSFTANGDGTVKLRLDFDVEIIYAEYSTADFYVSVYNSEGKMVAHERVYAKGSATTGLCTTANETIYDLKPGAYSITLSNN